MGRPSTARQRLLETACAQFSRVGSQAIGVDELCRRAKVNKGSFYHFFPSKNDLILTCLEVAWEHLRAEVFEPAFAPDRLPAERLAEFFDRLVKQQEINREEFGTYSGCIFCTLGIEIGAQQDAVRQEVIGFIHRNVAFLTGAYAEALETAGSNADPAELAETAYLLTQGALLEVRIRQSVMPLERAKAAALELLQRNT